jgi:hypothetical protein
MQAGAFGTGPGVFEPFRRQVTQPGKLTVDVVSGKKLPKKDGGLLGGKSDPFVYVWAVGFHK